MCNNLYVKPYSKLHHMIRTQSSPEVDKMYILQVVRRSCSCLCLPLLLLCVYDSVSVLGVVCMSIFLHYILHVLVFFSFEYVFASLGAHILFSGATQSSYTFSSNYLPYGISKYGSWEVTGFMRLLNYNRNTRPPGKTGRLCICHSMFCIVSSTAQCQRAAVLIACRCLWLPYAA